MPANTTPLFVLTPNIGYCSVSGSNAASDGSGNLTTLFSAGANGSRIERIRYTNAQASPAASTAMVVRFFYTTGSNITLLTEEALATATRSSSAIGATGTITFSNGLVIPTGALIKVCQSAYAGVQDLMHYIAEGGDY
jgi:hypothetical protein